MSIVLIAGLGNPGSRYENTRHNIGFQIVNALAEANNARWKVNDRFQGEVAQISSQGRSVVLLKPLTFMNESGRSIGPWLRFFNKPAAHALVIYDDITLDLGRAKVSREGGAGGHNGIKSIQSVVGNEFARYRVGIGAKPFKEMDLADYVLSPFSETERSVLSQQMETYLKHINSILDLGVTDAMSFINQRPTPSS